MLQPERDKNKTVANVVILNMPLNVKMTNIISHILKLELNTNQSISLKNILISL
jgi:hypothetical protein